MRRAAVGYGLYEPTHLPACSSLRAELDQGLPGGLRTWLKCLLPVHSSLVGLQLGLGVNGGTGHRRAGSSRGCGDVDSLGLRGSLSSCCHLQREEERGGGGLVRPGQLVPSWNWEAYLGPWRVWEGENMCQGAVSV